MGKMSGKGTMIMANGCMYEGHFSNDRFSGQGTLKCPNGSRYAGNFKKNKKHGRGQFTKKG